MSHLVTQDQPRLEQLFAWHLGRETMKLKIGVRKSVDTDGHLRLTTRCGRHVFRVGGCGSEL
jgi:hypothetical protein